MEEAGREDGDSYGVIDCGREAFTEVCRFRREVGQRKAVNGELDIVRRWPEREERVIPNGEGLVEFVGHRLIIWRVGCGRSVEVVAGEREDTTRVDSGREGYGVGAVGLFEERGHNVGGGGDNVESILMGELGGARGIETARGGG